MAKKKILRHGFKSDCEKQAEKLREELETELNEPLCAFNVAKHLNIPVYKATEFLQTESDLEVLTGTNKKPCEWHALTMVTENGNRIIIHNPFSSNARQQSDMMHEIAHVILKHEHKRGDLPIYLLGLWSYDKVQEEEAKCLGATLQLPRKSLLWARENDMTNEEMATHFNASIDMVRYRLNSTGVDRQLSYRKKNFGY